jgi:hypothetical protein
VAARQQVREWAWTQKPHRRNKHVISAQIHFSHSRNKQVLWRAAEALQLAALMGGRVLRCKPMLQARVGLCSVKVVGQRHACTQACCDPTHSW